MTEAERTPPMKPKDRVYLALIGLGMLLALAGVVIPTCWLLYRLGRVLMRIF